MNENERLNNKIKEQNEYIKKLEKELIASRSSMIGLHKNTDILQGNLVQKEVEINKLKSKTYGYDINKKLDYQQQRVKQYINNGNYNDDDNGVWDNEGSKHGDNMRLDQLAKEKQLWIGTPSQNINKLVNDIDKNYKVNYDDAAYNNPSKYYNNNNNINSNLRKYSPLILDQQNKQLYNKNK